MSSTVSLYEQALHNFQQGDADAALVQLREAAEKGDPQAAYRLGMAYANGEGLSLNYIDASVWIMQAAKAGLAIAQRTLGWLYANGLGVAPDDQQAAHWYLEAAAQGDARDQHFAGTMYRYGRYEVPKDPQLMLHWYTLSANQGFAPAQYELGRMLMKGKRVERDDDLAFQWLSLAVVSGSKSAAKSLQELSQSMGPQRVKVIKNQMMQRVEH